MDTNRSDSPTSFERIDLAHVGVVVALTGFLIWATALGGWRFGPIRDFLVAAPASDKIGHALIYGAITFFAALVAKSPERIRQVAGAVFAVGLVEEVRQLGEFGRAFTTGDLIANGVGVLAGVVAAMALLHRRASAARSKHTRETGGHQVTASSSVVLVDADR